MLAACTMDKDQMVPGLALSLGKKEGAISDLDVWHPGSLRWMTEEDYHVQLSKSRQAGATGARQILV
jgi:hypothetical protein